MKLAELNNKINEMIGGVNRVNNYNPRYNDQKEHPFQKLIKKAKMIVNEKGKSNTSASKMINMVLNDKSVKHIISTFPQGKIMKSQSETLEAIITTEWGQLNTGPLEIYA